MVRAENLLRGLFVLSVSFSMVVVQLNPAAAAESKTGQVCSLLPDNAPKVKWLLNRAKVIHTAYVEGRWRDAFSFSYPPHEGDVSGDIRDAVKELRRFGKINELVEWHPLRVLQCGPVAGVVTRFLMRSRMPDGEDARVPKAELITESFTDVQFWGWRKGEWLLEPTESFYRVARRVRGDSEEEAVLLGDREITDAFQEVWLAPGEISERLEFPSVDPLKAPSVFDLDRFEKELDDEESRKKDGENLHLAAQMPDSALSPTVCEYARALVQNDIEPVLRFWDAHDRKRAGFIDEVFHKVGKFAGAYRYFTVKIDRIQIIYHNSARVDLTIEGMKTDSDRVGKKLRITSYWARGLEQWYRVSGGQEPSNPRWVKEIRVSSCADPGFERILVESPEE